MFGDQVIDWLQEASIQAVAQCPSLIWDAVDRIMQRAVKRGLARGDPLASSVLAVGEKACKKRHSYLTVVSEGVRVLHVAKDHREESPPGSYRP